MAGSRDGTEESTRHIDSCTSWISTQVEKGILTPRDVEWLKREPSPIIRLYPVAGLVLGFLAAGAASRIALRSTLKPWTFTRTVTTAIASSGGCYWLGDVLHDHSITRFNNDTDSPTVAKIARFKLRHASAKDQVENLMRNARRRQDEEQISLYRKALQVLEETESRLTEEIILDSLVPEDVQVYSATAEEIEAAVESIVQEEIQDEGIPMSRRDVDLLVQNQIQYWKDRPVRGTQDPAPITAVFVGALAIYGRLVRKPPIRWQWLAISTLPVFVVTTMFTLGFGRIGSTATPDDWWAFQVAGMEVRSSIAHQIATSRVRRVLKEGNPEDVNALGSSSGDARIKLPSDFMVSQQEEVPVDSTAS